MIKLFLTFLFIFLVCVMQVTIIPNLNFWGVFGNLVLLIVIVLTLFNFYHQAFIWVLVGGILLDIFSNFSLGNFTISLLIIFLALFFIRQKVLGEPTLFIISFFGFASSIIFDLAFLFLSYFRDTHYFTTSFFPLILYNAIFNGFLIIFIYYIFIWLKEKYFSKTEIKI